MRGRMRFLAVWVVAIVLAVGMRAAVAQSPLDALLARAAELSAAGEHAEAYALLAAEEDAHIGVIAYDYALGRAALHAGRPERATLAFARVLALDPGHAGARIDMGRAYLALGNREQAQVAFEVLLALDPPPAVRAQLLAYLAQARRSEDSGAAAARGYLSASIGTSSNVNQAPGQGQVFVPGLVAVLQLADQDVGKSDSFASLGGGIEGAVPIRGRLSLIGSGEFLARENAHESAFDVGGVAGSVGLGWLGERQLVRVQVQAVRSTLGDRTSRDVRAISADVSETGPAPGLAGSLIAFMHAGTIRHPPEDLRIFDADFLTAGAGGLYRLGEKSTLSVVFMASAENERGENPSGDRRGHGLRLAWERVLAPKWRVTALLTGQNSRYDGFDPAFLTFREDRRIDMEAWLKYELSPGFETSLSVLRSVQDSNIPIYEYRRTDWTLSLRRIFK